MIFYKAFGECDRVHTAHGSPRLAVGLQGVPSVVQVILTLAVCGSL